MSGEANTAKPPHVVGRLGGDGQWRVLLMVPLQAPVWEANYELPLNADQAERLARNLLEYAALLRGKVGLPGKEVMP